MFDHHQVQCVAADRWWTAIFNDAPILGRRAAIYVDVIAPPVWDGDTVTMIDLDLDVIQRADRTVFVDDEDEFEEHRVALGYPAEVVAQARATAAELVRAIEGRQEPFASAGARWLADLGGQRR